MTKVFVYGTLRKGQMLSNNLLKSNYLGDATVVGTLFNLGWFPAYVEEGITGVVGEVYEIDHETLERLDVIEGYPDLYKRKKVDTPYGEAFIYYQERRPSHSEVIESGDWVEFVKSI